MTKRSFGDLSDCEDDEYLNNDNKRRRLNDDIDNDINNRKIDFKNESDYESDSDSDSDYDPEKDEDATSETESEIEELDNLVVDKIPENEKVIIVKNIENLFEDLLSSKNPMIRIFMKTIPQFNESLEHIKKLITNEETGMKGVTLLKDYLEFCTKLHIKTPEVIKVLQLDINNDKKYDIMNLVMDNLKKNSDNSKFQQWINTLIRIPFGKFKNPYPSSLEELKERPDFFSKYLNTMNDAIYGQTRLKENLMEIVGKWIINNDNKGHCLCILGDPGVGKTSIIKNGLSKALDLPFVNVSLAGMNDIGYLNGFSYTYEGAMQGRLTTGLIDSQCMNPIIFMDELDKIDSSSSNGKTIINKLIEITDFTQNDSFEDKYFSGIKLDLSKCLFVFTANNLKNIDPILRDRLEIIKVDGYTEDEKLKISQKYIIPEFNKTYQLNLKFKESVMRYIIRKYSKGSGVRTLKRCFETVFRKMNMLRLLKLNNKVSVSYQDNEKLSTINIDKMLKHINKAEDDMFQRSKPPPGLYI